MSGAVRVVQRATGAVGSAQLLEVSTRQTSSSPSDTNLYPTGLILTATVPLGVGESGQLRFGRSVARSA